MGEWLWGGMYVLSVYPGPSKPERPTKICLIHLSGNIMFCSSFFMFVQSGFKPNSEQKDRVFFTRQSYVAHLKACGKCGTVKTSSEKNLRNCYIMIFIMKITENTLYCASHVLGVSSKKDREEQPSIKKIRMYEQEQL